MKKILFIAFWLIGYLLNAQVYHKEVLWESVTSAEMNALDVLDLTVTKEVFNSDTNTFWLYFGGQWNNTGAGGGGGISNIVEDVTPQLGGNLDAQGFNMSGIGNLTTTGILNSSGSTNLQNGDVALPGYLTGVNSRTEITSGGDPTGQASIIFIPSGTDRPLTATDTNLLFNGNEILTSLSGVIGQGANTLTSDFTVAASNGAGIQIDADTDIAEVFGGAAGTTKSTLALGPDYMRLIFESTGAGVIDYIFDGTYSVDNDVARKKDVDAAIAGIGGGTDDQTATEVTTTIQNGVTQANVQAELEKLNGLTHTDSQNASAVPVAFTPTNYTPSAAEVQGHLSGIDTALGNVNTLGEETATTSRAALLTDSNGLVNVNNASDVTITIPTDASVAFDIGTVLSYFQEGAGDIIIAYSGGVTGEEVRTFGAGQKITLWKTATDTWQVISRPSSATLTQTEYDALTTALKNNGTAYFIVP